MPVKIHINKKLKKHLPDHLYKKAMQPQVKKASLYKSLCTIFPKRMRTRLHFAWNVALNNLGTPQIYVFKGNDVLRCGPSQALTGNISTSFSANNPSGLLFLLSSNAVVTGAVAPYNQYRVYGSSMKMSIQPTTSAASAATYEGVRAILLPASTDGEGSYNHTSLSAQSTNSLLEQPKVRSVVLPKILTTKSVVLKATQSTQNQFGFRYPSTIEATPILDGQISAAATYALPQLIWNWVSFIRSADDNASVTADVQWDIHYDVEFFNRNTATSATPV